MQLTSAFSRAWRFLRRRSDLPKVISALTVSMALVLGGIVPQVAAAQASCIASAGYTNCSRITYSGADQTFTVPNDYIAGKPLVVEIWGAGGGSSTYYGGYSPNPGGAGGGYQKVAIKNANPGDTFTVVVGQGGIFNGTTTASYGGGGKAGTTTGTAKGSGGGGFSGIFSDSAKTQPIAIAGGGGGGSPGTTTSGGPTGGGGSGSGNTSSDGVVGRPGTLSAGGAAGSSSGCGAVPSAGGQYLGGTGATNGEPGGGGGGGYFGGGGGSCQTNGSQNGGGGGGSGYNSSVKTQLIASAAGLDGPVCANCYGTTGNSTSGQYVTGVGNGGPGDTATSGGNGLVVFQYSTTTQTALTCDLSIYSVDNATLKKLSLSVPSRNTNGFVFTWNSVGSAATSNMEALAYNETDNFLYAVDTSGFLYRIDSAGTRVKLDTIGAFTSTATPSAKWTAAAFNPSNGKMYVLGTNSAGTYQQLYSVDFTGVVPSITGIGGNIGAYFDDFNIASDGFAYGIPGNSTYLRKLNLTDGTTTNLTTAVTNLPGASYWAATWMSGGSYYVMGSGRLNMYKIDPLTLSATATRYGGMATSNTDTFDGANCTSAAGTAFPTLTAPTLTADTSSGAFNQTQTINVLDNDATPSGVTAGTSTPNSLIANTVQLCIQGRTDAQCLAGTGSDVATSITVSGQGTYTAQANGTVTFVPVAGYAGTATSVRYIVGDSNNQYSVATISVTVAAPALSVAVADVTSGVKAATQTLTSAIANDTTAAGVTLTANTIKLCSSGQTAPNCTSTTTVPAVSGGLTQGVYTVTTSSAQITFSPCTGVVNTPVSGCSTTAFIGTAAPVTYQVSDSLARVVSATYTARVYDTLVAVADAPSAAAFGVVQTINVLTNDGVNAAPLVATSVRLCTTATANASCTGTSLVIANQGSYSVSTAGVVTFTPCVSAGSPTMTPACTSGFAGTATPIKYVVSDEIGQISAANITPTVSAPTLTATGQSKSVLQGNTISFSSITSTPGLASGTGLITSGTGATCLYNTGTTTCAVSNVVSVAGWGTYTLDPASGVVTFVADVNAAAGTPTAVVYRVTDVTGRTATASLTPIVPAPPVANNDQAANAMGLNQVISVTGNDIAGSLSSPILATSVKLCATTSTANSSCNLSTLTVGGEGTYTVLSDGKIQFVPVSGYSGLASAVKYAVTDSLGQLAGATLTIRVLPPPAMSAIADSKTGTFGGNIVFLPLSNDSVDIPGNLSAYSVQGTAAIDPTTLRLCGPTQGIAGDGQSSSCSLTSVTTVAGTYTLNVGTGQVTFVPAAGFVGVDPTAPSYSVCDSTAGWTPGAPITCSSAPLAATVSAPALATMATDQAVGRKGATQVIDVLANDATVAGAELIAGSVLLCDPSTNPAQSAPNCTATTLALAEGTYAVNLATGAVTFVPNSAYTGTPNAITYQVTDAFGRVASSTLAVQVVAPPAVTTPTSTGAFEATQSITTSIPSGGSITLIDALGASVTSVTVKDGNGNNIGTYSLSGSTITFVPVAGFVGTAPAVTIRRIDALGQIGDSTYSATSNPPAPAPATAVTSSGAAATVQSTTVTVPVGGSAHLLNSSNQQVTSLSTAPGAYAINATTGVISFTPAAGYAGLPTPANYLVTDQYGQNSTSATYSPSVTAPPAPTISAVTSTGVAGAPQSTTITVPAGGSAHLVNSSNQPVTTLTTADGVYVINPATGLLTFTPAVGFYGVATPINYTVTDVYGSVSSSESFTPTATLPAAPSASNLSSTGVAGAPQTATAVVPVGGSATLFDSLGQAATSVTTAEGVYSINASTGVITFTPASGFIGTPTSVNYGTIDAYGQASATRTYAPGATVANAPNPTPVTPTPTIPGVPNVPVNPPVIAPEKLTIAQGKPVTGNLAASYAVAAGSTFKLIEATPGAGDFSMNQDGSYSFKISKAFVGTAIFIYQVCLPKPQQDVCTSTSLSIEVKPAAARKPVSITIGYFTDGSPRITASIAQKINAFIVKYADYKSMECIGFTEGPSVLRTDSALSLKRAANACDYVRKSLEKKFVQLPLRSKQLTLAGAQYRRIVLWLRD